MQSYDSDASAGSGIRASRTRGRDKYLASGELVFPSQHAGTSDRSYMEDSAVVRPSLRMQVRDDE